MEGWFYLATASCHFLHKPANCQLSLKSAGCLSKCNVKWKFFFIWKMLRSSSESSLCLSSSRKRHFNYGFSPSCLACYPHAGSALNVTTDLKRGRKWNIFIFTVYPVWILELNKAVEAKADASVWTVCRAETFTWFREERLRLLVIISKCLSSQRQGLLSIVKQVWSRQSCWNRKISHCVSMCT